VTVTVFFVGVAVGLFVGVGANVILMGDFVGDLVIGALVGIGTLVGFFVLMGLFVGFVVTCC